MPPPPDFQRFVPLTVALAAPAAPWTRLPYVDLPRVDVDGVLAQWPRLHAGQASEAPERGPLAEAWALYHNGDFEQATTAGLRLGGRGLALANQATCIYANYLEPREAVRLALFKQVTERAAAQLAADPDDCHALYWQAYALGRYSQAVSVARALAQGFGHRLKNALEKILRLHPTHADAHIALGAFHAEVIDKVGPLVGRMTHGVHAATAIDSFERGTALNPHSASGWMEYGRGLLMLHGDARMDEATRLYERAAAVTPLDARERLDVELAKAGLAE